MTLQTNCLKTLGLIKMLNVTLGILLTNLDFVPFKV